MLKLKRIFNKDESGNPTSVKTVRVLSEKPRHNFSMNLVQGGISEGWLSLMKGRIVLHAEDGDHVFNILRGPGHYCCHCNSKLDGQVNARKHVAEDHEGDESPDRSNPSGYSRINHYEGLKEEEGE